MSESCSRLSIARLTRCVRSDTVPARILSVSGFGAIPWRRDGDLRHPNCSHRAVCHRLPNRPARRGDKVVELLVLLERGHHVDEAVDRLDERGQLTVPEGGQLDRVPFGLEEQSRIAAAVWVEPFMPAILGFVLCSEVYNFRRSCTKYCGSGRSGYRSPCSFRLQRQHGGSNAPIRPCPTFHSIAVRTVRRRNRSGELRGLRKSRGDWRTPHVGWA